MARRFGAFHQSYFADASSRDDPKRYKNQRMLLFIGIDHPLGKISQGRVRFSHFMLN